MKAITFDQKTGHFMRDGRNLIVDERGVFQLVGWVCQHAKRNRALSHSLESFANCNVGGENNADFFREMGEQFQPKTSKTV